MVVIDNFITRLEHEGYRPENVKKHSNSVQFTLPNFEPNVTEASVSFDEHRGLFHLTLTYKGEPDEQGWMEEDELTREFFYMTV